MYSKLAILLMVMCTAFAQDIRNPPGGPPYGAASGALCGSYPAPTLCYTAISAQNNTIYALSLADRGKLITFTNTAAIAVSSPAATGFPSGWEVTLLNYGTGTLTFTPTTSTINGAATLLLRTGQSARIFSDAVNFHAAVSPGAAVPMVSNYTFTKVVADGTLVLATYTSGITATGTTGQTCTFTAFNGGGTGATATVALTGDDTVAGGTALVITNPGSGYSSNPTEATAGNGTATCSGTVVVAGTITGPCQSSVGCIRVTGITPDVPAQDAAVQVVPFLVTPAKAWLAGNIGITTGTGDCATGITTATITEIGLSGTSGYFGATMTHNLKVNNTFTNFTPITQGNNTAASNSWTATIEATTEHILALPTGCSFTLAVPWLIRP